MLTRDRSHALWTCARVFALSGLATWVLLSCSGSGEGTPPAGPGDPTVPARVVVDGLDRPTQISPGPQDSLLVAQLNGGEGAAVGQVLRVDTSTGDREVLLDDLDKPTGVLWLDDELWVMQRRSLSRAAWDGRDGPGSLQVVLEDMPWNGRSEGTLTALRDGRIAYAATGSVRGDGDTARVVEDSGVLWAIDPATLSSEPLVTGVKNAYAHAETESAKLLTTEIGDNVTDPPDDELQLLELTADTRVPDAGWPGCPPPQECRGVAGPVAVFPAGSTPTGVTVLEGRAVVALFVSGELVSVDLAGWRAGDPPRPSKTLVEGLDGPHTVLDRGNGRLWVSEHGSGRVLEIRI